MDITCTAPFCPEAECGRRECWVREGFRLAVEALVSVDAPVQLLELVCAEATAVVPDWELAGERYCPWLQEGHEDADTDAAAG